MTLRQATERALDMGGAMLHLPCARPVMAVDEGYFVRLENQPWGDASAWLAWCADMTDILDTRWEVVPLADGDVAP